MLKTDDLPAVGSDNNMLGVRTPPHPRADVTADSSGNVIPGTGGMSVNKDWKKLPSSLIPKRFNSIVKDARGGDEYFIWTTGTGPFIDGRFASDLLLQSCKGNHGLVEPDRVMPLVDLQQAIANTRSDWMELHPEDAK